MPFLFYALVLCLIAVGRAANLMKIGEKTPDIITVATLLYALICLPKFFHAFINKLNKLLKCAKLLYFVVLIIILVITSFIFNVFNLQAFVIICFSVFLISSVNSSMLIISNIFLYFSNFSLFFNLLTLGTVSHSSVGRV